MTARARSARTTPARNTLRTQKRLLLLLRSRVLHHVAVIVPTIPAPLHRSVTVASTVTSSPQSALARSDDVYRESTEARVPYPSMDA